MILWTGHYSSRHPFRLDITRAGCDKALRVGKPAHGAILAPSADLLRWGLDARNRARGDAERMTAVWARYEADYLTEVRVRVHDCAHCGLRMDRDHNAAINICALGRSAVPWPEVFDPAQARSGLEAA